MIISSVVYQEVYTVSSLQSTIEEEQYVYDTDLSRDVPHHMFHLYPSAYFHNLLPFNIELVFEVRTYHSTVSTCVDSCVRACIVDQ